MVKIDPFEPLANCFYKFNSTKEGTIEFLKCLKEHGITVYWSDRWQRLVPRGRAGEKRGSCEKRIYLKADHKIEGKNAVDKIGRN